MCGIVGFTGHALEEDRLRRAVDSLRHRGPDGTGIFIDRDEPVGLGHARLSIIDLETGAQPLYSEDADVVLVCNGEIYDFERLREELRLRGHVFSSGSDSEVILHLYQDYGLQFVEHLRGEFAFLLYDKRERVLLAVRDRFGIKPLFFNEQDGHYLFASEAKAMFATERLRPKIDVRSLRDFLCGVIPDSMFDGVRVVPPGCLLKVDLDNGGHEISQYWDLDLPSDEDIQEGPDLDQSVRLVREAFEEAVRLRLRADVPVGVFLSGGIDSSIVAATVAKYHPGTLKAFNIAFPGDEAFDEFQLSKNMAKKIDAEFHSVTCDRKALLDNTEDCLWVTELPFANFHGVGKFMLSRLAAEHVKVVLTGEGADEVFLGYVAFQPGKGAMSDQVEGRLKAKGPTQGRHVRRIVEALGFLPLEEHARTFSQRLQGFLTRLFHPQHRAQLESSHPLERLKRRIDRKQTDGRPLARRIQYFWCKSILAPYILSMLGDRQEMGHSIEGRTPFLDHHLFEKARQIPDGLKIHDGVEKYVLREAFKDEITDEIYRRKKWPYSAPPLWIRRGLSPELDRLMEQYLSKEALESSGLFSWRTLRQMRWISRVLFFDCALKRSINAAFAFVLTAQILDRLYVQDLEASLQERVS